MTIMELIKVLKMQEEILQFTHFTNADAWELGSMIVMEAERRKQPILLSIRLNSGLVVFQYAFDGMNLSHEELLSRKFNTVKYLEVSSLQLYMQSQMEGVNEAVLKNTREFAALGGGFPIRIEEVGVIGAVVASGEDHVAEHDLLVKCISKYLHIDEVPRIRAL